MTPVTLQISLAPSDYRHAVHLLPHQIRTWRGQVAEILLTVDLHRSSGRFSDRWQEGVDRILPLARSIEGVRVEIVGYEAATRVRVSDEFFGGAPIPAKDHRGGPYYSYFFALSAAEHDHVLHVDSDILFGGGSQTWVSEALARLAAQPDILVTAPLPGPPRDEGPRELQTRRDPNDSQAYYFDAMSSRLFLLSRSRFRTRIGALHPQRPARLKARVIALLEGNPCADLPEHLFTSAMRRHGLTRYEFLGRPPGMWSLHPPYRNPAFYRDLPALLHRIESGDLPAEQLGDHDINDSLVDWSDARAALRSNRVWRRLWGKWMN